MEGTWPQRITFWFLLLLGGASQSWAQQVPNSSPAQIEQKPRRFLPVPTIITEPAVGAGLGLAGLFFHDSKSNQDKATTDTPIMPSGISVIGGAYTSNHSHLVALGHLAFWRNDTLRYRGAVGYGDINLDFYSLGKLQLSEPLKLNLRGPALIQTLSARWRDSNWFFGAKQLYRHVDISLAESPLHAFEGRWVEEVNHAFEQIELENNTSGLGLVAEYDSTDSPFNPELGYNYNLEYMIFDSALGSDSDYHSYIFSALNYWHLTNKARVALRLDYEGVSNRGSGNLPVYVLPYIDLRGIAKSRYQGEDIVVAEMELGYHLTDRWKLIAFSGLGRAANGWDKMSAASSKTTLGTGFRYLVSPRYGFRMGIDVAHGPEENAIYIQAGSSW
ncbi:BamA/TamA family outer membrane protein [Pseudoalteromonas sp. T1lg75]|uniref:BamA/TamA family outer membrane protein n=1 Tax=Pseudoalteromonas sp. T1lg75 TaxID=2077102 RepID=UPI000CF67EBF|nr:BamA/TamA family outer membrane protein [Pseudoalteromonas sp. T1lg75]